VGWDGSVAAGLVLDWSVGREEWLLLLCLCACRECVFVYINGCAEGREGREGIGGIETPPRY
jgi:hypothetical protein